MADCKLCRGTGKSSVRNDKGVRPDCKACGGTGLAKAKDVQPVGDEGFATVKVPAVKGNVPNKEYKIPPPPPKKAKDVEVEYHFLPKKKPAPKSLSILNKEDLAKMTGKGGEMTFAPKRGKDDKADMGLLRAQDVEPVGEQDGSKRYPVAKSPANEWVMPRATKRPSGQAMDRGVNVAPIVKTIPRSKRPAADKENPFEIDTDKGAERIVRREAKSGLAPVAIAKKYGFSLSFVKEVLRDVKPV